MGTYESFQKTTVTEEAQATRPGTSSVLAIAVAFGCVMGFMQAPASASLSGAGQGALFDPFVAFLLAGAPGVMIGLPIVGILAINIGLFPFKTGSDLLAQQQGSDEK